MVYMDYEPLTKGEREGCVILWTLHYIPPCYSTVRDTLKPHALFEFEDKLHALLQHSNGLLLAVDIWTSWRGHSLHLRCLIHLLQLSIKDAIAKHCAVNSVINKVGKVVKTVRNSTLITEEIDKLGVCPTTACTTRWNSQLRMIELVLKMFGKDVLWQNRLTSITGLLLQGLVRVLKPFDELTDSL